ncbi:hypothetical protein GTY69_31630 [Streptomyces sp. SID8364]|nr:hypothetical protein [Streptomyces sp. SID8364]
MESLLADTDTYPPVTKLPTYKALCRRYGVAQTVVGTAMEALASQEGVWIRPHWAPSCSARTLSRPRPSSYSSPGRCGSVSLTARSSPVHRWCPC